MFLGARMLLAPLLVALGVGYIVIYFAKKEAGVSKVIGYIVGTAIIVISCVLIIDNIGLDFKMQKNTKNRPMHQMKRGNMMEMPSQGQPGALQK